MFDAFSDTLVDNLRLLPFLFLTYLVMELLEHKAGHKSMSLIQKSGKFGPLIGGILGAFPQCGFSASASSLYAGRIITIGTLLSVYLSTSDEMFPIMISASVAPAIIIKILILKVLIGIITGFIIEFVYVKILKKQEKAMDIHTVCKHEKCSCEEGVLISASKHTLKIFVFLFLISFLLNMGISYIGENNISAIFTNLPFVGVFVAGIVGLVPNCAASIVITELYLQGMISTGALIAGLLVSAGVGILILFRLNRNIRQNLSIVLILYASGVIWGTIIELLKITL
ncbi:MAG: putative manganese transporter [Lachnospiraceae bacterium]|nr:putative manganese transporter [Lachnospiraceae bacterium]